MPKKQIILILIISCVVIALIGLIVWLKPNNTSPNVNEQGNRNQPQLISNTDLSIADNPNTKNPTLLSQTPEALANSLEGTQIDCALTATAAGQLVLNSNIRNCFEYFLTQMGEKTLAVIDQQVRQHLEKILPTTAAQQATDLWQRYIKYREAEGSIKVTTKTSDPEHLQTVFNALSQLRQQHFKPNEIEALFGDEVTYNQYTIDRINIMENKALNANQKAQQLKQRFAQLPPDLQQNMQEISKLQDLRELTQQLKASNGSKAQLRQMREQLVGAAAADRLEQLDQTRASWQSRIDNYLVQRDSILTSKQADQDKQAAIDALRTRQFSDPAEQQRAITFEHFKDQNIDPNKVIK